MNELYVNILFILVWYLSFSKSLFRSSLITVLITSLCYYLYGYGFYLVNCYSAAIVYFLFALKPFNVNYKIYKNIIGKVLLTTFILFIMYFYEASVFLHFLPYISFLLLLWTYKLFKNNKANYLIKLLSDILWMIYAYKYHIYSLFIYKLYIYLFNIIGNSLKKIVKFTNAKTR